MVVFVLLAPTSFETGDTGVRDQAEMCCYIVNILSAKHLSHSRSGKMNNPKEGETSWGHREDSRAPLLSATPMSATWPFDCV